MAICKGCGAVLQTTDPTSVGYTPKNNSEYCQRCFRLIHYGDLTMSMRRGIPPEEIYQKITKMDCLIVYVVDLFDLEGSMIPGLSRKIDQKDILLVGTKRDLLPATLSFDKLAQFVYQRLQEYQTKVKGICFVDPNQKESYEETFGNIKLFAKGKPVVVIGKANVGKSTFLNHLAKEKILTSSIHPGTTLDFVPFKVEDVSFFDTPGIEVTNSVLQEVSDEDLKKITLKSCVTPQIYVLNESQSLAIGGLVRLDFNDCDKVTVVWYGSDQVPVHRSKVENADALWQKHLGELLSPTYINPKTQTIQLTKTFEKMDIVIDGLGWACVSGNVNKIVVKAGKNVKVTIRKAMI